jgi:hypothetical protein
MTHYVVVSQQKLDAACKIVDGFSPCIQLLKKIKLAVPVLPKSF